MPSRKASFAAIFASLVLVSGWTVATAVAEPGLDKDKKALGPDKDKKALEQGKELFTREWTAGDSRSHAGDGLGPVYNAKSCATCHRLGGIGGAGSNETNVSLVSVFITDRFTLGGGIGGIPIPPQIPLSDMRQRVAVGMPGGNAELEIPSGPELAKIHPILRTQNSFPLHRFGVGPEFDKWKESIFPKDKTETERSNKQDSNRRHTMSIGSSSVTLIESKRNAPPLFGTGLIDTIPDKVLDEVAAEQAKASGDAPKGVLPVRGRVARLKDGHAGKFGWKASVASLSEFTFQAASSELGLEVPGFARAAPPWKSDYKAPGIDLTREQCDTLTRFVASLPRPVVRPADSPEQASSIEAGQKLFASVGCAVCHRPKLGEVDGIYSDLLLHDMGTQVSDSGSYTVLQPQIASNDKDKEPRAANQLEWRTPPLWGLRDSAPYLHDGRAKTIVDAVALHGGEGAAAALRYKSLSAKERAQVELFLRALAAPPASP
jgi:CxxC motif-containing protein (DUF1111 family)